MGTDRRVAMELRIWHVILSGAVGFAVGLTSVDFVRPVEGQPRVSPHPGRTFQTDTIANIAEWAIPAVVNIDTVTRERNPFAGVFGSPFYTEKGVGSGFIVDPNGLIVTNEHVISGAQSLTVTLTNGRRFTGRVVGQDPVSDIALVKIQAANLPTLKLGDSDRMRVGEWVVAIGSPLGLQKTVTTGIISAMQREIALNERVNYIQTDAPINPGNSGGPLLNISGEVIGVNNAVAAQAQGIGFAIPSTLVRNIVNQLQTHGRVERPWMGVALQELTPAMAAELGKSSSGVLVAGVTPNGPAAQAGIRDGDVITRVDDVAVSSPGQLVRYLSSKKVGAVVRITYLRDGRTRTANVVLREMPANIGR